MFHISAQGHISVLTHTHLGFPPWLYFLNVHFFN